MGRQVDSQEEYIDTYVARARGNLISILRLHKILDGDGDLRLRGIIARYIIIIWSRGNKV